MAKIEDQNIINETDKYIDDLFSMNTTKRLNQVDLTQKSKSTISSLSQQADMDISNYEVLRNSFPSVNQAIGKLEIELRVDAQPNSGLNLFFAKGRLNRSTNTYQPRPWYEVELGVQKSDTQNSFYPPTTPNPTSPTSNSRNGTFTAYFERNGKYFKIKMVVSADFGKNIASHDDSGGRATLGKLLKGKLEDAGLLKYGDRITSDTLEQYGKTSITFHKFANGEYFLEF